MPLRYFPPFSLFAFTSVGLLCCRRVLLVPLPVPAPSVALVWGWRPMFEWAHPSRCSHLVYPASILSYPSPFFYTCRLPKQHGPVRRPVSQPITALTWASWDQRSHPPPLTAALCQTACLARGGWGVARQLDNNFSQWNRVSSSLGTLTRVESLGPLVCLVSVLC